ncbi:MAG: hypothetical protein D3903_03260 [Candidatus Electrothrix sp. GM3_4]|nr:hypothetical protein [Candidatus Electrothrix sp. GM3_4]
MVNADFMNSCISRLPGITEKNISQLLRNPEQLNLPLILFFQGDRQHVLAPDVEVEKKHAFAPPQN